MDTFARHVFGTLTYKRLYGEGSSYVPRDHEDGLLRLNGFSRNVSKDFNRFVQRFRRLNQKHIGYFRSIELHKDGYPHIHVLFQFDSACLSVYHNRFFDSILYHRWKRCWQHGLSDFQPPRKHGVHQLTYIMKYISKNATSKTVWKKLYPQSVSSVTNIQDVSSCPTPSSTITPSQVKTTSKSTIPSVYLVLNSTNRLKLLSWSRNFDFSPFFIKDTKNSLVLTQFRYTRNS